MAEEHNANAAVMFLQHLNFSLYSFILSLIIEREPSFFLQKKYRIWHSSLLASGHIETQKKGVTPYHFRVKVNLSLSIKFTTSKVYLAHKSYEYTIN